MRRQDREINDRKKIDDIIRRSVVCRLGMSDGAEPYVVPMNFGYDGRFVYFHGAREGQKIDILRANPRVCLEFDIPGEFVVSDTACVWTMKYQSVIAHGVAEIADGSEEKRQGLSVVMAQVDPRAYTFPDEVLKNVCVLRVRIESISGKESL